MQPRAEPRTASMQMHSPSHVLESFQPAYADAMSTKHIRNAADLIRFGAGLKIDCGGCGAARTLDGMDAFKIGGMRPLSILARRLRCKRCGRKEARLTILSPPAGR